MKISVDIKSQRATKEGFAVVNLIGEDKTRLCQLDVQYSELARLQNKNEQAHDFLLLAACVYAIDKMEPRNLARDMWTRKFSLTLPVSNTKLWKKAKSHVESCLSFLTGDAWTVKFEPAKSKLRRAIKSRHKVGSKPNCDAVCLFSGGLDSLIGAINRLESNSTMNVLLVGHHDGQVPGPFKDQTTLLARLLDMYPGRVEAVLARVGHSEKAEEITMRGRSLIFIAMGVLAASALGPNVPLLIPENGTIALNVPLTPSRRGSCSTRTAHPYYLQQVREILDIIGICNPIHNPLDEKTKGEAVAECLNQNAVRQLSVHSVSCAKRGRKNTWVRRNARACGRCMPCIYRRAAMHAVRRDDEVYGNDFCSGAVDLDLGNESGPNDLRACFAFLNRKPSLREIAAALLASGSLEPAKLTAYAGIVERAMEEVRQLLRDKADTEIRTRAGAP